MTGLVEEILAERQGLVDRVVAVIGQREAAKPESARLIRSCTMGQLRWVAVRLEHEGPDVWPLNPWRRR